MSSLEHIRAALRRQRELAEIASSTGQVAASECHELELREEAPVNWHDVVRILEDALVVVEDEGGVGYKRVAEAIEIIEPTLAVLVGSAYAAERRLVASRIAWFDYILVFLPGSAGNRARDILAMQRRDQEELMRMRDLQVKVKDLRRKIADAVDGAVHRMLLSTNDAYRDKSEAFDRVRAVAERLETVLGGSWSPFDRAHMKLALLEYARFGCEPKYPLKMKSEQWASRKLIVQANLEYELAGLKTAIEEARQQMQARRDEHKRRFYDHD